MPGSHCPPAVPAVLPARSVPLNVHVLVLPMSPVSMVEQGKMDGSWGKNSHPPALLRGSPCSLGCPVLDGAGNGMRSKDWDGVEEEDEE